MNEDFRGAKKWRVVMKRGLLGLFPARQALNGSGECFRHFSCYARVWEDASVGQIVGNIEPEIWVGEFKRPAHA